MKEKKNTLWKSILKALKRRLKPTHILFLALILSGNAFAWFIFMDRISSDIDVRVKAWNVSFTVDNQNMTDYINFTADDIYPGMTTYTQSLSITNDSDVAASLSYEVVSVQIFEDEYTTVGGAYTEQQLVSLMQNNYPFTITLSANNSLLSANGGSAIFSISIAWPYESVGSGGVSNDSIDTYWGNQAYDFKQDYPTLPCIKVRIKLSAIQVENNTSS